TDYKRAPRAITMRNLHNTRFLWVLRLLQKMEALAMNEKLVRDALEIWEKLSKDPESRFAFEARLKTMIDKEARIADAKREGKEEEKLKTVHNLLQINAGIETIVQAIGLTKDDIMKIQKKSLY